MTRKLYTPSVLALATSLAGFPFDESLPFQGSARSPSCGSTIVLGLDLDAGGRVRRIGLRSHACAIGQASAAIFAAGAAGLGAPEIRQAGRAVAAWLAGNGPLPDWPGMETIAAAGDYPARHGAVMLPWNAANEALPQADRAG